MKNNNILKFFEIIDKVGDRDYLFHLLNYNLAPTLANIKTGTMLNLKNGRKKLKDSWIENEFYYMKNINLNYFILKETKDSILILFYNYKRLKNKLKETKIKNYLYKCGYYNYNNIEDYLHKLKSNFRNIERCPNEVGIFLGYPLNDVIDFNHNKNKCKLVGYWKCYNNDRSAKETFKKYDEKKLNYIYNILKEGA